ncbi:MAG TPA: VOC family protein [Nocardioidaceae bacterium]|nr:VOC family protein [Nocardioidaceae bacterium]
MIRIAVTSVFVQDQEAALRFYTEVLGFVGKQDVPMGEFRWLTVTSADDPDGIELLLEPSENPIAGTYQQGLFEQGIPATSFAVDDLTKEHARLTDLGVRFTTEPTSMGPVTVAVIDDTCGNLIQLAQLNDPSTVTD